MTNSMLSIRQLAAESNESVAVWRKRIQRRQIAFVRFGRNVRVPREAYADFVALHLTPVNRERGRGGTKETVARGRKSGDDNMGNDRPVRGK